MKAKEKRVLVVDDEEAIRTLVKTVLRRRGLLVNTAKDGKEALDQLTRCRYALILLDLTMPRLSGWDVLAELDKTSTEPVRPLVIIMTAGSNVAGLDSRRVLTVIRKPFDIQVLTDAVIGSLMACEGEPQLQGCPDDPDAETKAFRH